ncbi:MAG: RluA family pseudouridine synthase [Pseudomonadota bacterium]
MVVSSGPVRLVIPEALAGQRLDRALASVADAAGLALSRSRIMALIESGAVAGQGISPKRKVRAGEIFTLDMPPPVDPEPLPEDIPLDVVYEDADVIVVNKPAGMVVHPAPGAPTGTLVNALLHHCGESLAGIGGERRPGIVHRIDRQTSGLLVSAKTDRAHAGLSEQFAGHSIERRYLALCWGRPDRADPRLAGLDAVGFEDGGWIRVDAPIARHPQDRKRMAVARSGGRHAVTHLRVLESFGPAGAAFASLIECRLETGRTHQIRVHTLHIGHSLIGDPVYGRVRAPSRAVASDTLRERLFSFKRQALHAATLGFVHPATGNLHEFSSELPQDMNELLNLLRRND